ncbi:MAG: DUF2169 domain-containing protein, partial [Desulfobacterales bacterium]|nr:DUF2169 domain-containing protein [Desulfobacterales bacterium]
MEIINQSGFQIGYIAGRVNFPAHSLTLIIKGTFDLAPDGVAVPSEEQLYPTGDELYEDDAEGRGSLRHESDFACFKPGADLLLAGKCHSPTGRPIQATRVTFQVGENAKTLTVFGDRYWKGIGITKPAPFTEMELRYENSFGGEGYPENPVGKGYKKERKEPGDESGNEAGGGARPLPNIEDPRNLISSKSDRPAPAGFGPLGRMWRERSSKMGRYKGDWLETRWPWFPKDFDWSHFNAAPADMRPEEWLTGDEPLYFENMHPAHPRYHCRAPGLRPRCFVNKFPAGNTSETRFREAPLNLDTLWVDMEAERLILVWRGVVQVASQEFEEIEHLYLAREKLADPARPVDHYRGLFREILAGEDAEFEVETAEAPPETPPLDVEEEMARAEKEIAEASAQLEKSMAEAGVDMVTEIPPPSAEDKKKEAELLKELGITGEIEPTPLTREKVMAGAAREEDFSGEDLSGVDLSGLALEKIQFQNALLAGVNLEKTNLTGAKLGGANLAGADLSGAILKNAELKDADLTGARLTGADLGGAALEGAILERADLVDAVLERAMAENAIFQGADLTRADLKRCRLHGADLSGSVVHQADFGGADLREASIEGAEGVEVRMAGADLTELKAAEGCDFRKGDFR